MLITARDVPAPRFVIVLNDSELVGRLLEFDTETGRYLRVERQEFAAGPDPSATPRTVWRPRRGTATIKEIRTVTAGDGDPMTQIDITAMADDPQPFTDMLLDTNNPLPGLGDVAIQLEDGTPVRYILRLHTGTGELTRTVKLQLDPAFIEDGISIDQLNQTAEQDGRCSIVDIKVDPETGYTLIVITPPVWA